MVPPPLCARSASAARVSNYGSSEMEAAIGRSVFLAVLVQLVVRLIVPDYVEMSGPETSYFIAGAVVVVAFFQPCLWWRTIVGYIAGVIIGIFAVTTSTIALTTLVAPGEIASESVYILIPALIFGLLPIGSSVLAWREG